MTIFRGHVGKLVLGFVGALALTSPRAEAKDGLSCTKNYEGSQVLKKKGELLAARQQLIACMRDCPAAIQQECTTWFDNLEPLVPSMVIHVESAGEDRSDVRVELDGKLLTEKLDGKETDVDPGPHQFKFTLGGHAPVTKDVVMHEGEKLRPLRVMFDPPPQPGAPAGPEPTVPMHRPVPRLVYWLGGAALVGAGSFAYFGLASQSDRKRLESTCSPDCSDAEVNVLYHHSLYANISAGVGAAALATGLVLFITRPSVPVTSERAAFSVAPTPGGGEISATYRF